MSSVNYYAKYLKYKKKYLDLVNETKKGGNPDGKEDETPKSPAQAAADKKAAMNKKSDGDVPQGTECSYDTVPNVLCKDADGVKQDCFYGYCHPVGKDGKKLPKPLASTVGQQLVKKHNKTPAQKLADDLKAKQAIAKQLEEGQKGGEDELNINELLSESSFN